MCSHDWAQVVQHLQQTVMFSDSDTEALIHLIKMNVGIGVMAMPSAFYNSGMLVGIVAMVFMAIVTVHCMHLLVSARSDLGLNCIVK